MDVADQLVRFHWDGPVAAVEPPQETLYHARLRVLVPDGDPVAALRRALAPLGGHWRTWRLPFVGVRARWRRPPYDVAMRQAGLHVVVHCRARLRPAPLRRLVAAIAAADARDLEVEAEVRHFGPALSTLRACTPCQARRF